MKKIVVIITSLFFIIFLFITLLFLKNKQNPNVSTWQAIPKTPTIIIKVNQLSALLPNILSNTYFSQIDPTVRQPLNKLLVQLDSLLQKNKSFKPFITDSALLFVIYTNEKTKQINWLAIAGSNRSSKRIKNLINELNKLINETFYLQRSMQVYYYHNNGLLVVGNNKEVINESYQQVINNKTYLFNDTSFLKVQETSGKKALMNLYINIPQLSDEVVNFFNTSIQPRVRLLLQSFNWIGLDIQITNEYVNFQGFGNQLNPKTCWTNVFSYDLPSDFYDFWVFPANSTFFTIHNINDNYYFIMSLKNKLKNNPSLANQFKKFNSDSTLSIHKIISLLNHTVIRFSLSDSFNRPQHYWTIKTNSTIDAIDWLNNLSDKKKNKQVKIDSSTYQIFQLKIKNLPNILFGDPIDTSSYQYASVNGDYIVFSSSHAALENYYSQKQKLLVNDTLFKSKCLNLFATKSNFFFYTQMDKCMNSISYYLNNSNLNFFEKYIFLTNTTYAGFQLSNNSNMLYANGFIYSPSTKVNNDERSIVFDTTIVNIFKIERPDGTNSNYLGIQDANYTFTLMSYTGQKLAALKTDGMILGNPKIIHIQNNEWIIFNTKSHLYMVNHLGRSRKGYPVKFKSKATNGLQIADFDNNKNYRIYVAFENKSFVALDTEAKKVKGWKFRTTDDLVVKPAICFTFNKKDYIIVFTKTNLYILDRQGNFRFKPKLKAQFNQISHVGIDFKNAYFKILILNRQNLFALYPDNHIEQLYKLDEKSKLYFSDDLQKAISISNKNTEIINLSTLKKNDLTDLPFEPDTAIIFKDNAEYYFLINNLNENKLILYNENGKYVQTFNGHHPLTAVSLNTNFKNMLIYSNSKQLIMSKFNGN